MSALRVSSTTSNSQRVSCNPLDFGVPLKRMHDDFLCSMENFDAASPAIRGFDGDHGLGCEFA